MRQQEHIAKNKIRNQQQEQKRIEKQQAREQKLTQLREKKFEEELLNQ
jgi:hypothetical protein